MVCRNRNSKASTKYCILCVHHSAFRYCGSIVIVASERLSHAETTLRHRNKNCTWVGSCVCVCVRLRVRHRQHRSIQSQRRSSFCAFCVVYVAGHRVSYSFEWANPPSTQYICIHKQCSTAHTQQFALPPKRHQHYVRHNSPIEMSMQEAAVTARWRCDGNMNRPHAHKADRGRSVSQSHTRPTSTPKALSSARTQHIHGPHAKHTSTHSLRRIHE